MSGRQFTIVGVTPRSFFGVDRLWVPETLPLASQSGQVQALATIDPDACQLTPPGMVALTEALRERVRALPGVEVAGFGLLAVSDMRGFFKTMWVEGHDYAPDENRMLGIGVIGTSPAGVPWAGT